MAIRVVRPRTFPIPRLARPTVPFPARLKSALAAIGRFAAWLLLWRLPLFVIVFYYAMLPAVQLMPTVSDPTQDMGHFKLWIAWIGQVGIENAYSGVFPAQYVIYPPLSIYFYQFVGQLLQVFPAPPEWLIDRWPADGFWVEAVIRAPVVAFHAATVAVIYWSTVRWKGSVLASLAAFSYALNPAVLFDLVYWAQPDSYHSFFALIALLFLLSKWPELGWAAMAIAALAKPQAWIYVPVLGLVSVRRHGWGKTLSGGIFFLGASLAVVWPWLNAGTGFELASVFVNFSRVMPVVTANAHNLWWGIMGQDGLFKADSAIFWGPFSYQTVGLVLLLAAYAAALIKAVGEPTRKTLFSTAGFMSLTFFFFATQIHENHAFLVFPMLAMAWVADVRLLVVYLVVAATMFANLALHDPILEPLAGPWLAEQTATWPAVFQTLATPEMIAKLSVAANFGAILLWLGTFFWDRNPVNAAERQRRAGWAGFIGGVGSVGALALAAYLMIQPAATEPTPTDSMLDGKISLKPVEEPYLRITGGGGGIETPEHKKTQTIYLAIGAAIAIGSVSAIYIARQGTGRSRAETL